jgi:hypothetical protein
MSPRLQSALAIVNGITLICSHCERDLFIKDVEDDREFCRHKGLPAPLDEELLCRRKDCQQLRKDQAAQAKKEKDEDHFVGGKEVRSIEADDAVIFTGTRRDQDGHVHPEKPLVDLALTKYDLMDDEGKLRRPARPDQEILQSLLDKPPAEPRCELHGTPGCGPCRLVQQSREYAAKHANDLPSPSPSLKPTPTPTQESVHNGIKGSREVQAIAKEVTQIIAARPVKQGERKKKSEPKELPNLRKQHGYTPRQLTECFAEPGFNPKVFMTDTRLLYTSDIPRGWTNKTWNELHAEIQRGERHQNDKPPRTMEELWNMLPTRKMHIFSPGQVQFYKDYASGNHTIEESQQRIAEGVYAKRGFEEPDYLIRLENEIIRRAWERLLLPLPAGGDYHAKDFEVLLDESYAVVVQGIDAGAEQIGGSVIGMKHKPTTMWGRGSRARLNSFDNINGRITEEGGGDPGTFDSSRGALHDNYGEESNV